MKRILAVAFGFFLILCGCQPTPPKDVVVNKNENVLEETIKKSPAPIEEYKVPAVWNETIALNSKLLLEINVPVEIGESNEHPVYSVSYTNMSGEFLYQWINAVFPNVFEIRDQEYSREELENQLLEIARGTFDHVDENGVTIWEPYEESELENLKETIMLQINTLPKELTYQSFTASNIALRGTSAVLRETDGTQVWMKRGTYDEFGGNTVILSTRRNAHIQLKQWVMQEHGDLLGGSWTTTEFGITQQEAENQAELVLSRYGRTDFKLASVQEARSIGSYPPWDKVDTTGWYLVYTPTLHGTVAADYNMYDEGPLVLHEQFSKGWQQENIRFYISNKGIEQVTYGFPYIVRQTENSNVALLPFSEVQGHIRDMMKYALAWTESKDVNAYGIGNRIIITRVALTTALVPIKNDRQYAMLIPTWAVFYITEHGTKVYDDENVLLINAIDGSLIQLNS